MLVNQPAGYDEMATVSASNQWRAALMFLPGLLNATLLPILSSQQSRSAHSARSSVMMSHRALALGVPIVVVPLMVAAGWLIGFYGADFIDGRKALVYTLAATAVSAIASPAGSVMLAEGRTRLSLALNMVHGTLFLGGTYLFVGAHGAAGMMVSFLGAHVVLALSGLLILRPSLPAGLLRESFSAMTCVLFAAALLVR
jgi:O-antigen/teichoic acid export membrane protein